MGRPHATSVDRWTLLGARWLDEQRAAARCAVRGAVSGWLGLLCLVPAPCPS